MVVGLHTVNHSCCKRGGCFCGEVRFLCLAGLVESVAPVGMQSQSCHQAGGGEKML